MLTGHRVHRLSESCAVTCIQYGTSTTTTTVVLPGPFCSSTRLILKDQRGPVEKDSWAYRHACSLPTFSAPFRSIEWNYYNNMDRQCNGCRRYFSCMILTASPIPGVQQPRPSRINSVVPLDPSSKINAAPTKMVGLSVCSLPIFPATSPSSATTTTK